MVDTWVTSCVLDDACRANWITVEVRDGYSFICRFLFINVSYCTIKYKQFCARTGISMEIIAVITIGSLYRLYMGNLINPKGDINV